MLCEGGVILLATVERLRVQDNMIFQAALCFGVHSTSNRNEYQKQKNNNVSEELSTAGA
jgi:hypothetical protein